MKELFCLSLFDICSFLDSAELWTLQQLIAISPSRPLECFWTQTGSYAC